MMVRAMLADMSIVSYTAGVVTLACDERIRGTAENKLPELAQLMSSLASTRIECRLAEATVKVRVGNAVHHTVAEGNGPVNAIDRALRKAVRRWSTRPRLDSNTPLPSPG